MSLIHFHSDDDSSTDAPETSKSPPTPESSDQIVFLTQHSLSLQFHQLWWTEKVFHGIRKVQTVSSFGTPHSVIRPFQKKMQTFFIYLLFMNALTFSYMKLTGWWRTMFLREDTVVWPSFSNSTWESHATVVLLVSEWILIGRSTGCLAFQELKPSHLKLRSTENLSEQNIFNFWTF